jgi:hypothetical protein
MNRKPTIIRHRTLKECFNLYGVDLNEKGWWEWSDADGRAHRLSNAQSVKNIRKRGFWGFIDNKNTIHVWIRSRTKMEDAVALLAHEIGHAELPYHRQKLEEQKASKYERVAKMAFMAARELMV